jgi:hypothetical protein
MKKEKIGFKELEYNDALYKYESKKFLKDKITKELKALNHNFTFKDCANVIDEFYTYLETKFKDSNPLKLKGQKLAELLEIDLTNLENSVKNYIRTDEANPMQPITNDFVVYADSDAELQKYNDCIDFITALKKFDKYTLPFTRKQDFVAFTPFVKWNVNISDFEINHTWIKQND